MKLKNASQGISHHTGLSLATENVLRFAGLNPSSVAVSGVFLDKRPNCVKQDSSQLVSGLTFRNRYLGEVPVSVLTNSYSHLPQIKVHNPSDMRSPARLFPLIHDCLKFVKEILVSKGV